MATGVVFTNVTSGQPTHDAFTFFSGRVIRCAAHMFKRNFLLLVFWFAGPQCGLAATAFVGARIILGTGAPAIEDGVLLVDGTSIVAVGPREKVQIPVDAQTVGLDGKFIIPGLISAHSHLGLCQGAAGPQPDHYNRQNVQHQLEQYERYGVTSVLSLGCNADVLYTWKEEQKRGQLAGADFFTADRGFGVKSGAPPFPLPDQIYTPADPAEARAEVDQTAARKPDLMKLWVDDLFGKNDNAISIIDLMETYRDAVRDIMDLYLSTLSMRTNEVMRVLAVITCIFSPLTFIVGVYGMNFEFMPELKWQHGYLSVWLTIIAVSVGMIMYFKLKKWL